MTEDEIMLLIVSCLFIVMIFIFVLSTLIRLDKHDDKIEEIKKKIKELENDK